MAWEMTLVALLALRITIARGYTKSNFKNSCQNCVLSIMQYLCHQISICM